MKYSNPEMRSIDLKVSFAVCNAASPAVILFDPDIDGAWQDEITTPF